jgi:K+-transporting ATPase ATPase C chain
MSSQSKEIFLQLKIGLFMLIIMSFLTGLIYPLFVTGIAELLFPWQAKGSLLFIADKPVGSLLIGQSFNHPKYFWGRPSATHPFPYNAASSRGSNLGPSNPDFLLIVRDRALHLANETNYQERIPVDLVTASGSGLDPDISLKAAYYQVERIARVRHLSPQTILKLIADLTIPRQLWILGEPRINVLTLNLALDKLGTSNVTKTAHA